MSIRIVRASAIVLALLLAACASAPAPQPAPTPQGAAAAPAATTPAPAATTPAATAIAAAADDANAPKVYIYRPKAFVGWALRPTVMIDGKDLINVKNGTMWVGSFKPGKYLFQMDDKQSGAELDLKPGDVYYFRVDIVPGFWKGGGRMTLVMKEQGGMEVKELAPLPPNEVAHADFRRPM